MSDIIIEKFTVYGFEKIILKYVVIKNIEIVLK